jgi:hypothetical protein
MKTIKKQFWGKKVGLFSFVFLVIGVAVFITLGASDVNATTKVLDLKLDEGQGNIAYDSSLYGNDGSIHGASWSDGKFGKSLSFDGVNDYVKLKPDPSLDITDEITIEAWIKRTSQNGYRLLVYKPYVWGLHLYDGHIRALFRLESGSNWGDLVVNGATTLSTTNWHHIAVTYNHNTRKGIVYLDGKKDGEATASGQTDYHLKTRSGSVLQIVRDNTEQFKGLIDEVRIYSRALSPLEIMQLYAQSEKVLELKMDEGSGNIAKDSSLYKNHGQIHGARWVESKFGKSLSFDGKDAYIEIPNSESLSLSLDDSFTLEQWMKINANNPGSCCLSHNLIRKYNGVGVLSGVSYNNEIFLFLRDNNKEDSVVRTGGHSTDDINNGAWHHVVFIRYDQD